MLEAARHASQKRFDVYGQTQGKLKGPNLKPRVLNSIEFRANNTREKAELVVCRAKLVAAQKAAK